MDAALKKLCAQVAQERFRRPIWNAAHDLRAQAQARLKAGADQATVGAWLRAELQAALAQQVN